MDQLNGIDAFFLFLESARTPMHVGGISIYNPATALKKKLTFDDIVDYVADRTHLAKPMRKKLSHVPLGADFPYWTDDADFDIRQHMRHYSLPKPGTWEQLTSLASDIFAIPLDMSGPLWEFTYIDGIDAIDGVPKGSFAILSKAHHCAIDGASGVDIASAVHSLKPEVDTGLDVPPYRPQPEPGLSQKILRSQINAIKLPFQTARSLSKLAPGVVRSARDVLTSLNWKPSVLIPRTRFNKDISNQRSFGGSSFSIADARKIRQSVGNVTLNDVILAVVSGAMREYLEPLGELPKRQLIAMAPIAVKSKKRSAAETGNDVANMSVGLATHISDPIARLKHIHHSASKGKAVIASLGADRLSNMNKLTPPFIAGLGVRIYARMGVNYLTRPNVNTMVTNVPGPSIPLYFCGAEMVKQINMAPLLHGAGLVHTVFSYCGEVTIGFLACGKMLPDPKRYEACLRTSFENLKAATANAAVVAEDITSKGAA